MTEHRDTVVTDFARRGYRTVAVMPGLRQRWPEGAFYGFDDVYGAARLDYRGPEFGWFAIPDQFTLAKFDTLELDRAPRPNLFVFYPTISTHFPFSPTPPYQPAWHRIFDAHPWDGPDVIRAYAQQPDWTHFAPGYVDAVAYTYETLAGYLRKHAGRDIVFVILGDHQPAAAVSGEGASWSVPVHVVASRPAILDRLLARGSRTRAPRALPHARAAADSARRIGQSAVVGSLQRGRAWTRGVSVLNSTRCAAGGATGHGVCSSGPCDLVH